MQMLRIAVCEDAPAEAANIARLLEAYGREHPDRRQLVDRYPSAEKLLEAQEGRRRYDLYLLDIIMPGLGGIELARALNRQGRVPVIFITSSKEHALEAFSARAVNYLVKPVTLGALSAAIDDALALFRAPPEVYTRIPSLHDGQMAKLSDIVYVEVTGHRLSYHLAGGETVKSKVLRIPFEQVAKDLIDDPRFLRPHRSFLVNAEYIVLFSREAILLEGDIHIPISRLRYAEVKASYMQHYLGQG